MTRTTHPAVGPIVDALLTEVKAVLGKKLIGCYLYGSSVWGDFDWEISDLDLMAALSGDINERELLLLEKMHADFAGEHRQWDDRIEVQYISLDALKTFKWKVSTMAVISPGEPLHMVPANSDWLMNWYFVQEYGITLMGPCPETLIDPISQEEFIAAVREHALSWYEHVEATRNSRPYQSYAILTMCRALYTLRFKEQVSKRRAAAWAQAELPEYSWLIAQALKWREDYRNGDVVDEATYPITAEFVHCMVAKIRGISGDGNTQEARDRQ